MLAGLFILGLAAGVAFAGYKDAHTVAAPPTP